MPPKKEIKNGRKGGTLGKQKREQIKQSIIDIIEKGDFHKYSKLDLANDKNITRPTLDAILEEIKDQLVIPPKEIIKVDILALYERMKKRILYWWDKCETAGEDNSFFMEKQVMKELREVLKDFRQTCIDLGIIDKVADKYDIQADITQRSLVVNVITNGDRD